MSRIVRAVTCTIAIALAAPATAQQNHQHAGTDTAHSRMHAQHHGEPHAWTGLARPHWPELSETAREQVARVEAAVAKFATPEAARSAGFRPALGLIPTMGVHWVNRTRVRDGQSLDLDTPDHLMFAPVNGKETLVGIAFAYNARPDDVSPDGFDGDLDAWHTHPDLSPPGTTLTMLHVWFVPSPDGPFAGHNPWLPYWAAGMEPPPAELLATPENSRLVRGVGLAIAETIDAASLDRRAGRIAAAVRPRVEPRRDAIRALLPQLEAARKADDDAQWRPLAEQAVAQWEAIRDIYLTAIPVPAVRERLAQFYQEMLIGGHGAHGGHTP